MEAGQFPTSLRAYTTIPKAKRGKIIDHTKIKYLDVVHMDIVFGDCISIGGLSCALILVDCAICYNWVFSPKSLSVDEVFSTIKYFKTEASILAKELQCDYDKKIFGSAMNLLLLLLPLVISLPMD